MIIENMDNIDELAKNYEFRVFLPDIQNSFLTEEKLKKINNIIISDREINSASLAKVNDNIAKLLDYLMLVVKK